MDAPEPICAVLKRQLYAAVAADMAVILCAGAPVVEGGWLPSRRSPVLATADRAKNMAAIRVQLVKYIVHLLDGTVWPAARGAWRIDQSMSGGVSHASCHSGRLPAARSATAVTAAKVTMASGISGGICCFMRAF